MILKLGNRNSWGCFKLPKFVKKFKDFVNDRKDSALNIAGGATYMNIDRQFKMFFLGIDSFIHGNPSKNEELAFTTLWKYPAYGIDKKYNHRARDRCKNISKHYRKHKLVLEDDVVFLVGEVRPYFEASYQKQTGNLASLLSEISEFEAKQAFKLFKKSEKTLKGKVK